MRLLSTTSIFYLTLFSFSCLLSCKNQDQGKSKSELVNTKWVYLDNENIKILLPKQFKKSSRYRIKEEFSNNVIDSSSLRAIENSLELLEFDDSYIDVYVDTTKKYRLIVIMNIASMEFNESDARLLKGMVKNYHKNIANQNTNLLIKEKEAVFKRNKNHRLSFFKTLIQNRSDQNSMFKTLYFLVGDSYSLVIHEFSIDAETIDNYLWHTKRS